MPNVPLFPLTALMFFSDLIFSGVTPPSVVSPQEKIELSSRIAVKKIKVDKTL